MNLAKQGYEAYQESQSGHQGQDQSQPIGVQGSAALNSNDNNRPTQAGRKYFSPHSELVSIPSDDLPPKANGVG